jgi:hypothetical protein
MHHVTYRAAEMRPGIIGTAEVLNARTPLSECICTIQRPYRKFPFA